MRRIYINLGQPQQWIHLQVCIGFGYSLYKYPSHLGCKSEVYLGGRTLMSTLKAKRSLCPLSLPLVLWSECAVWVWPIRTHLCCEFAESETKAQRQKLLVAAVVVTEWRGSGGGHSPSSESQWSQKIRPLLRHELCWVFGTCFHWLLQDCGTKVPSLFIHPVNYQIFFQYYLFSA